MFWLPSTVAVFCTTEVIKYRKQSKSERVVALSFLYEGTEVWCRESSALGTLRSGCLWLWCSESSSLEWHKHTSLCTLSVDPCDNVFFKDCNSGILFISLRTFFIPAIAFWAGDTSPRTLQSGRVYGFLRLFHVVSILYYWELCCGSVFSSRIMKTKGKYMNILSFLYLYA